MSGSFWRTDSLNYAAFALPAFFLFLGLEFAAAKRRNQASLFKFDSSIANLTIGIAERLLNLFLTASFYSLFVYVYENFALWSIPNQWWVWILLILATDLVWYWYHRLGHEINIFWAAHIVHHHSEEFNYTVSARITTLQALVRNMFWCLLPLMGFHPAMVFTILVIHGTYSFFTHTEIIRHLGWLEYILITPSHHRVHHSSNEKYLNKNYGDLFVFWDKLFGTFQKEEEKPIYGLTHPLKSYSFIWQHFHYFIEMTYAVSVAKGFKNKLRIIFGRPELLDQSIRPRLERYFLAGRAHSNTRITFRAYLVAQVALAVVLVFMMTLLYNTLDAMTITAGVLFVLITLINCGALLEQRRWIYYLENARLILFIAYLSHVWDSPLILLVACAIIFIYHTPIKRHYFRLIYGIRE